MARKQLGAPGTDPTHAATLGDLAGFPRVIMFGADLTTARGAAAGPRIWVGQGTPAGYVEATDLLIQTFESNKIDLVYNSTTGQWPAVPANIPAGVAIFWWSMHDATAPAPPKRAIDYWFEGTA